MKSFFDKLGYRLSAAMQGCYGMDQLGYFTTAIMVVFVLLGLFNVPFCGPIGFVLCIYCIFRCYSKNTVKRRSENDWFMGVTERPRKWLKLQKKKRDNKDTTCYFVCKTCKTAYSVPKGKGKIRTTCPHCGAEEIHTT